MYTATVCNEHTCSTASSAKRSTASATNISTSAPSSSSQSHTRSTVKGGSTLKKVQGTVRNSMYAHTIVVNGSSTGNLSLSGKVQLSPELLHSIYSAERVEYCILLANSGLTLCRACKCKLTSLRSTLSCSACNCRCTQLAARKKHTLLSTNAQYYKLQRLLQLLATKC